MRSFTFLLPGSQFRTRPFSSSLAVLLALIGARSMLYYHQELFMPRVLAVRAAEGLGNGYWFGNDFCQAPGTFDSTAVFSLPSALRHRFLSPCPRCA
jgi:hypothetical protein